MNGKSTFVAAVFGLSLLATGAARAQTTQDPSVGKDGNALPPQAQPDSTKPASGDAAKLADMIKKALAQADAKKPASGPVENAAELALKQNPEIRLKEHAVRTAELELSVTQQRVLGKITVAYADLQASVAILQEVQRRLKSYRRLAQGANMPVISEQEISEAEISVAKYQAEVISKETELASLCGVGNNDFPPKNLEGALATALKKNLDIRVKEFGIRTAEFELQIAQEKILRRIDEAQADYKGTAMILLEIQGWHKTLIRLKAAKGSAVSDLEIGESEVTLVKYKTELARKAAELDALTGINIPARPLGIPLGDGPPTLKTYTVTDNADTIAKTLQETYKASPTFRVTAVGKTQIMVYAPPGTHMEIAKQVDALTPQTATLTYAVERGKAQAMAKLVSEWFQALAKDVPPPAMAVDDKANSLVISGDPRQIALAVVAIKSLDKETPVIANADKIRKALAMPVVVVYSGLSVKEVLAQLQGELVKVGHYVNLVDQSDGSIQVNLKLGAPVPLAGVLQLLEDRYGMHFFFRDYGIVGTNGDGTVPAGAILVSDFVRRVPEKEAQSKGK